MSINQNPASPGTGNKLAIGAAVAALAAATTCSPTATATLEIAVYTVKSPEEYIAIREETRRLLSGEPGYLWWHTLHPAPMDAGHSDGGQNSAGEQLFADVLAWESPEAAHAAAAKVEADRAYQPFVQAIARIHHFTHYRAWNEAAVLEKILNDSTFIEIAAYTVKDPEQHKAVHSLLYESKLPGTAGLVGGARMERLDNKRAFGDLLGWQTAEAFQATGAAMMQDPELKPFFEGSDESIVFALFTKEAGLPNK